MDTHFGKTPFWTRQPRVTLSCPLVLYRDLYFLVLFGCILLYFNFFYSSDFHSTLREVQVNRHKVHGSLEKACSSMRYFTFCSCSSVLRTHFLTVTSPPLIFYHFFTHLKKTNFISCSIMYCSSSQ